MQRLDRAADKLTPEIRDLERAQDGSEINARELELVTGRGRNLGDRRNDDLLNLLPKGIIAFSGSGITDNLVDKAKALGIPILRAALGHR